MERYSNKSRDANFTLLKAAIEGLLAVMEKKSEGVRARIF